MLLSVNRLKAPALVLTSTLQLALNLFDFRRIVCSDCDVTGEDYVQHVNECVSRDVHQLSEHGLIPRCNLKIALRIRNPAARSGQLQVDENTCLPIAPTQTSNDLPRALTELGQPETTTLETRQPSLDGRATDADRA
jgi:hypothetical protein